MKSTLVNDANSIVVNKLNYFPIRNLLLAKVNVLQRKIFATNSACLALNSYADFLPDLYYVA